MTQSQTSTLDCAAFINGIVGGIGGGVTFAVWGVLVALVLAPLLQTHETPILLQIAAIVHSSSSIVGMILHLFISALLGVTFVMGITFWRGFQKSIVLAAAAYGALWWILGTLTMLPLLDGLAPRWNEALIPANLLALVGHLIYGFTLGLIIQWRHETARELQAEKSY